jgi:hypothetical protein
MKTYFRVPYLKWFPAYDRWAIHRCDGNLRAIWRHQLAQFRLWWRHSAKAQ